MCQAELQQSIAIHFLMFFTPSTFFPLSFSCFIVISTGIHSHSPPSPDQKFSAAPSDNFCESCSKATISYITSLSKNWSKKFFLLFSRRQKGHCTYDPFVFILVFWKKLTRSTLKSETRRGFTNCRQKLDNIILPEWNHWKLNFFIKISRCVAQIASTPDKRLAISSGDKKYKFCQPFLAPIKSLKLLRVKS